MSAWESSWHRAGGHAPAFDKREVVAFSPLVESPPSSWVHLRGGHMLKMPGTVEHVTAQIYGQWPPDGDEADNPRATITLGEFRDVMGRAKDYAREEYTGDAYTVADETLDWLNVRVEELCGIAPAPVGTKQPLATMNVTGPALAEDIKAVLQDCIVNERDPRPLELLCARLGIDLNLDAPGVKK